MDTPTNWREALGGQLTAAQRWAEYRKLRAAMPVDLADWIRAATLDRLNGERQAWSKLPAHIWAQLAEQLADEAAREKQANDPRLR